MAATPSEPREILTVSEITGRIGRILESEFGDVWVRGELGRVTYHGSGHVYLSMKDGDATLECAIWRSTVRGLRFRLEEGQEVVARGAIDVYAPRGNYKLIVRHVEPLGEGALQLAFEQLRRKLEAEGLFDAGRKQTLPAFPRRVAVVTSRTGAAVRDLVKVMHRRLPGLVVVLVSVRVQGEGAAEEIAEGLRLADRHACADVIVVGRGGGSLEDLFCFNEEVVARAIAACETPVVSAVGHETDTTIADLVADVRAATPSHAGELVVPDREDLVRRLGTTAQALGRRLRTRVDRAWQAIEALADRPVLREPQGYLRLRRERSEHLAARLVPPLRALVRRSRDRVTAGAQRLEALSPLAVLGRGYSLTRTPDGRVVRGVDDVAVGDVLTTRLGDGAELESRVEARRESEEGPS